MKKTISPLFSFFIFAILFTLVAVSFLFFFSKLSDPSVATTFSHPQLTVVIDPGHGGEDGGAIGVNGCLEKDLNLSIAKKLSCVLSGLGIKNVLTRSSDTLLYDKNSDYEGQKKHLDMQKRLEITSSYPNVIFVSIHQNSFPEEKYSGFQAYYSPNSPLSQELALNIERYVKQFAQSQNNRKAKSSAGSIYLLDELDCPAVLLECGFLSNGSESELLCSEDYQNKLCRIIGASIESFINS